MTPNRDMHRRAGEAPAKLPWPIDQGQRLRVSEEMDRRRAEGEPIRNVDRQLMILSLGAETAQAGAEELWGTLSENGPDWLDASLEPARLAGRRLAALLGWAAAELAAGGEQADIRIALRLEAEQMGDDIKEAATACEESRDLRQDSWQVHGALALQRNLLKLSDLALRPSQAYIDQELEFLQEVAEAWQKEPMLACAVDFSRALAGGRAHFDQLGARLQGCRALARGAGGEANLLAAAQRGRGRAGRNGMISRLGGYQLRLSGRKTLIPTPEGIALMSLLGTLELQQPRGHNLRKYRSGLDGAHMPGRLPEDLEPAAIARLGLACREAWNKSGQARQRNRFKNANASLVEIVQRALWASTTKRAIDELEQLSWAIEEAKGLIDDALLEGEQSPIRALDAQAKRELRREAKAALRLLDEAEYDDGEDLARQLMQSATSHTRLRARLIQASL